MQRQMKKIKKQIGMKNQVIDKRILVVLTMMLALVMNAKAQQKPAEGQPMEQR